MCGLWTWMTLVETSAQMELILSSTTSGCQWVNTVAQLTYKAVSAHCDVIYTWNDFVVCNSNS